MFTWFALQRRERNVLNGFQDILVIIIANVQFNMYLLDIKLTFATKTVFGLVA